MHIYRWNFIYGDAHGLSYLLDPRYLGAAMPEEDVHLAVDYIATFPYEGATYSLTARAEWAKFKLQMADWKANHPARLAHLNNHETSLYDWWMGMSDTYGHLKELALVVFAMPHSTSSCERSFSSLAFIHNKLRNRLGNPKVKQLLKVYLNMNQLKKRKLNEDPDEGMPDDLLGVDFINEIEG